MAIVESRLCEAEVSVEFFPTVADVGRLWPLWPATFLVERRVSLVVGFVDRAAREMQECVDIRGPEQRGHVGERPPPTSCVDLRFMYFHFLMAMIRIKDLRHRGWKDTWAKYYSQPPFPTPTKYIRESMLLALVEHFGTTDRPVPQQSPVCRALGVVGAMPDPAGGGRCRA